MKKTYLIPILLFALSLCSTSIKAVSLVSNPATERGWALQSEPTTKQTTESEAEENATAKLDNQNGESLQTADGQEVDRESNSVGEEGEGKSNKEPKDSSEVEAVNQSTDEGEGGEQKEEQIGRDSSWGELGEGDEQVEAHKAAKKPLSQKPLVYVFPIREDIMPSAMRLTHKCLENARELDADLVVIDMDTYGGLVNAADSIRTMILNSPIPVYVFINNQAASAGALISIAADKIFMRGGASIGAATVVDHTGEPAPPKFQSFMMGMMRATAEAHGKVVDRVERGDTVWRWYRDPLIAAAMVDPSIEVEGLVEKGQVLTFSTEEAIKWNYCEGRAASVKEILEMEQLDDYEVVRYEPTTMDKLLGFLTSPGFQGVLIMLIVGGIYFEIQTPGIGLPSIVAVLAALLYFSPLYIEGLLANWELVVFIVGIILLLVEIFVTPGFGVLGITGIVAVLVGLSFAMIDTDLLKYIPSGMVSVGVVVRPIMLVIISVTASIIISMWVGRKILVGESRLQGRVVLNLDMTPEEGFLSHFVKDDMVGKEGVTATELRPAGRVLIDGQLHQATSSDGQFIERGEQIVVIRDEGGVLYCEERV